MSAAEIRRRTGGRSARVRDSVIDATVRALAEHGADSLSVPQISKEAGVHETTIYRRWGTREHVIIDALLTTSDQRLPIPNTGSVRTDLIAFAHLVADYLNSPLGSALARSMSGADDNSPYAAARTDFWRTRMELASEIIDRAIAAGELSDATDSAIALELLIAPLTFRALLTHQPLADTFISNLVDQLLRGLRP